MLPKLPSSRYKNLAAVVHQVAGFWKGYDSPRGPTLFAMLGFNTRWFASHWDQKAGKDVFDASDGIWYRAFPGIGFQFHPLENFGKLNNFVAQKNTTRAEQLAQSLLDRSVVRSGGLAWEYYFRFEGGQPPWISGMAQAVAAQALSGAGTLLADPTFTSASQRVCKIGPVADPLGPGRPVDPAARLQQRHSAQRPAPDHRLTAGLRRADGRPGRNQPGRPAASRGRRDAAALRYRLLVAVLARRRRGSARLSPVRCSPARDPVQANAGPDA